MSSAQSRTHSFFFKARSPHRRTSVSVRTPIPSPGSDSGHRFCVCFAPLAAYKAPDAAFQSYCIRGFDLLPVLSGRKHQKESELFLFRRRIRQRQKLRRVTVAKTGNRLPVLGLFSEDPVVPGSAVSVGIAITHLQIYSLSIRSLSKKIHFCSFGERVFHTYRPFKTAESRRQNCRRLRICVSHTLLSCRVFFLSAVNCASRYTYSGKKEQCDPKEH